MILRMNCHDEMIFATTTVTTTAESVAAVFPEELLHMQSNDTFCLSIRARTNAGEDIPFVDD